MDWQDYERVTKNIYETLGKESGVTIECYGNNCKVEGKSGVKHQIDVLAKHSDGIHEYKTAIECKYWNNTINKDIVMKAISIIEDCGIEKGVIVAKKGFTPDAIQFAKSKNIGLAELREVRKEDYGKDLPFFEILNTKVKRVEILNFSIYSKEGANKGTEMAKTSEIALINEDRKQIPLQKLFDDFKAKLQELNAVEPTAVDYELDGYSLSNIKTGESTLIQGISIVGLITEKEIDLGWKPLDKIWLIMKTVFEDKIITVSEKGAITESKFRFY